MKVTRFFLTLIAAALLAAACDTSDPVAPRSAPLAPAADSAASDTTTRLPPMLGTGN